MQTKLRYLAAITVIGALVFVTGGSLVIARQQLESIIIPAGTYCDGDTCLVIGDTSTAQPTTASPSPDPDMTATPTPEVTRPPQPTSSPAPTSTLPSSAACEVGITATTLNVRPAPADFTSVLAQVSTPERYIVSAVEWINTDEWARITLDDDSTGWIAVNYQNAEYAVYTNPQNCADLRFPAPPAAATASIGPTFTPLPYDCRVIAPEVASLTVRTLPRDTANRVGTLTGRAATYALSRYDTNGTRWYKLWWFNQPGWIRDVTLLTTEGNCDALPAENPFQGP